MAGAQGPERVVLRAEGRGVQVYRCVVGSGAAGAHWEFERPEAKLLVKGKEVGEHGAGPVWRYKDGSAIHGAVVQKTASPEAGAVPWLVLRGVNPEGEGLLRRVVEIRRTETHGGAAPEGVCRAGGELRVPYTAVYTFLAEAR